VAFVQVVTPSKTEFGQLARRRRTSHDRIPRPVHQVLDVEEGLELLRPLIAQGNVEASARCAGIHDLVEDGPAIWVFADLCS
jgi:hypothetical protein